MPCRMTLPLGQDFVPIERQHLRRKHLQLQRHRQAVLRPPRPETEEHLAGNEHLARGAPLAAHRSP